MQACFTTNLHLIRECDTYIDLNTVKMSYDAYSSAPTRRLVKSTIIDVISVACACDLKFSGTLYKQILNDEPFFVN